jgi:uncharacterized protein Yka (UPF0111/DUF47 family)
MFSLQNFLAKDEKWFDLLESGAQEARWSVQNLIELLKNPATHNCLTPIAEARRNEKKIMGQLRQHLLKTFLTPLEREDIDALAEALYKIPKTVEKFGERFVIAGPHVQNLEVARQIGMLDEATAIVVTLVKELRGGVAVAKAQSQNNELQRIEGEADKLMLQSLEQLLKGDHSSVRVVVLKDLYELLEKIFDRCRDAGNAVFHIALKYS